jgi:DNA-binding transcriptional ArsR family regulator
VLEHDLWTVLPDRTPPDNWLRPRLGHGHAVLIGRCRALAAAGTNGRRAGEPPTRHGRERDDHTVLLRSCRHGGVLLGQLSAALGFELAPLSPSTVNLADRVPATKRDDGRDEREYKRADRGDHLQHDDDRDHCSDNDENAFHSADYRTRRGRGRESAGGSRASGAQSAAIVCVASPVHHRPNRTGTTLIDRIRQDIKQRLDQLLSEADKLRQALVALDPRPTPAPTRRNRTPSSPSSGSRTRTAPGKTKAKVLGALSSDGGMTAGEVAKATGLGRGTVSTTLSKLAKNGEVAKAERGYRLPSR